MTAVERRVSDIEDKLPLVAWESHVTHQLAKDTNNGADDMENCLRHNNICTVGLLEKTEGRDLTSFVEGFLIVIFAKNSLSLFFTIERAHCTAGHPHTTRHPPETHPCPSPTLQGQGSSAENCPGAGQCSV